MEAEWVLLLLIGAIITYVVLRKTIFGPKRCEKVYWFIDDTWTEDIDYNDLIDLHGELMHMHNLSSHEAELCISNYHMGLPWFKNQEFLN